MILHRPKRFLGVIAAAAATLALLLAAAPASAQTTIGELAPGTNPELYCVSGPFDGGPTGAAASVYMARTAGIITSWSTNAGEGLGQQLTFKVYRPLAGGKWLVVGHDGPRLLTPSAVNTFPTEIPVKAGDVIGSVDVNVEAAPTACVWSTGNPADTGWIKEGDAPDGTTITPEEGEEKEVRYNETATVLVAPTVASVSPGSGPAAGGTPITISGAEFADVKSVTVGAASVPFTVASEASITATVPAGTAGTSVPVTVTTAAGSASSTFGYEAAPPAPAPSCKVPRLKGKKLKGAKKALRKAHCKLGKVTKKKGVTAKKGKVVHQKPKAGSVKKAGFKVSVKLG